jgi:DNA-binding XRE family transcriptional regulator
LENKYIPDPVTIGEKIRNKRLELQLLQKDVSTLIGVTEESITNWENNLAGPQMRLYPKVILFLGYYPFLEDDTLACQIKKYRYLHRLSQKRFGRKVGVDGTTICSRENSETVPKKQYLNRLQMCLRISQI